MSPEVTAAIIAASASVLALIGTLAAQYFGRRATSRDTQRALGEQWKQLDRTLTEQRTRTLNERFTTAAEQLGSDKPAVRLAGVYAMAGLADDWKENRQTCIDVLCAYLRLPYKLQSDDEPPAEKHLAFEADRQVRLTVIDVIVAHLKENALESWNGFKIDFSRVVFDGGDFSHANFSDSSVKFDGAKFASGQIYFFGTKFSGDTGFYNATFSGSCVNFFHAEFSGSTSFYGVNFSDGVITFPFTRFTGRVAFTHAEFSGGSLSFRDAIFSEGCEVSFNSAIFSGAAVSFEDAHFWGGAVDFSGADDWSHPPGFDREGTVPPGLILPEGRK
jgi:uncharacterized protein YjbI with pentapeptide repeats